MSEKKEYITKDEAISAIHTGFWTDIRLDKNLNAIPAADVEPVVRGELRINDQGFLECSACGKTLRMTLVSILEMKRCYVCGAYLERSGSGE